MARHGYERYGAHGSDWGTSVSTCLAQRTPRPRRNPPGSPIAAPDPATSDDLTPTERRAPDDLQTAQLDGAGYTAQQATKPQTVGYALTDSPAGLCAWIAEKFWAWVDHDGRLEDVVSRDAVLDTITLYWLTRSAASSARLYWESIEEVTRWFTESVEDAVSVRGGHFAALEQPAVFVDELRAFFDLVR